jgi:hypothetical protein
LLSLEEFMSNVVTLCQEERGLVAGVMGLLEGAPVLAAKGLVCVALLSRASTKFLLAALQSRLAQQVQEF